jgi:cyclophilin family peptidyl-prolyl cis-trans isomerase
VSRPTVRSPRQLEELDPRVVPANDLFLVPGAAGTPTAVRFDYVSRGSDMPCEIGVVRIDDGLGTVNGLAPGAPGYAAAALARARVLFAPGAGAGAQQTVSLPGGAYALYLVAGGSAAQARAGASPVFFSLDAANSDRVDHVRAGLREGGGLAFAFEDLFGGGDLDFDDAVVSLAQPPLVQAPAVATPGQTGQTVQAHFTRVSRDADFENEVGFFLVDGPDGRIGTVRPGDPGYAAAALRSATRQVLFTDSGPDQVSRTLPAGRLFSFYVVADGSADQVLQANPNNIPGAGPLAYFSFPEANPDRAEHLVWRSPGEFGVEDQLFGGDRDFNDVVVRFEFGTPTGTPTDPPPPQDTTPPAAATLILAPASDTGTQGDFRSGIATGILTGTAEAGATVELRRIAVPGTPGTLLQTATVAANGSFQFNNVPFASGGNGFGVVVVDRAGNRGPLTQIEVVRALAPTVTDGDIPDQTLTVGQNPTFNLLNVFDTLARFQTSEGNIDINLFESRTATVENFLRYVNNVNFAGNYDNSLFHRLDKDFVLQGGGFKFNDAGTTTATTFPPINDFAPIANEPGISNTRGTIAMAKLGGNPNSATNEFFFNLEDNGGVAPNGLDFQNGGFTVFGEVTTAGQQVIDQIESTFQEFNGPGLPGAPPFPVRPGANTANFPANIDPQDLARIFRAVTLTDARSLTFSTPTSTMPTVATAAIVNNTLTVTAHAPGATTISFTATSSDGLSSTVTFDVTVS